MKNIDLFIVKCMWSGEGSVEEIMEEKKKN